MRGKGAWVEGVTPKVQAESEVQHALSPALPPIRCGAIHLALLLAAAVNRSWQPAAAAAGAHRGGGGGARGGPSAAAELAARLQGVSLDMGVQLPLLLAKHQAEAAVVRGGGLCGRRLHGGGLHGVLLTAPPSPHTDRSFLSSPPPTPPPPPQVLPLVSLLPALKLDVFSVRGEERAFGVLLQRVSEQMFRHADAPLVTAVPCAAGGRSGALGALPRQVSEQMHVVCCSALTSPHSPV